MTPTRDTGWTEESWNPTTGCTRISPGCAHCWAERMARRLQSIGQPRYARGFQVTTHEDLLEKPLHWVKPRRVYVSFMGDLFHDEVPDEFIARVFDVMARSPRHRFHLLTKRPERLARMGPRLPWPANVWAGVTVEDAAHQWRADLLRRVPAAVRYLVLEPLLGPIDALDLSGIGWVILGGESGPGARPLQVDWVRSVRDQCVAGGVPFYFKQWGGVRRKETGRELDGRLWSESPREAGQLAFEEMGTEGSR
ncbi:MAG TPA: phage Gp37/Gp68 family protein [Thermoleophilia bacterium]|nr:phage Gp37/Gp68 family protein [Thermoleophilia bacterium]